MSQIPTPPASPPPTDQLDKLSLEKPEDTDDDRSDAILSRIDNLLAHYLDLLHEHQTLQAKLGKELSSGFFDLARANTLSASGYGYGSYSRRYGADYYDQRMKASRRTQVEETEVNTVSDLVEEGSLPTYKALSYKVVNHEGEEETEEDSTVMKMKETTNEDESNQKSSKAGLESEPAKPKLRKSKDPISWFGILSPPALRAAQTHFTAVIAPHLVLADSAGSAKSSAEDKNSERPDAGESQEKEVLEQEGERKDGESWRKVGVIAALASVTGRMKIVEREVTKLRAEIGLA